MRVSKTIEILPGLFRIGDRLGEKIFYQYLFFGERSILVDTGVPNTPESVILPAFEEIELKPSKLDYVLITHSDVDHFGGNHSIRKSAPKASFISHELDAPMIENKEKILKERYGWYERYGIGYSDETWEWLEQSAGTPIALDLRLSDEISITLAKDKVLRLVHLPGHTAGHMAVYDRATSAIVIGDAILGNGVPNTSLQVVAPPPYYDAYAYRSSIQKVLRLKPKHLFAAHYPPMHGEEVSRFLKQSLEFVQKLQKNIISILKEDKRSLELKEILEEVDTRMGPFRSFSNELAASIRAHLQEFEKTGRARRKGKNRRMVWSLVD